MLKVVGAGLGRTGTTSLKTALEQLLGGQCYHMLEVGKYGDEHAAQWSSAYAGAMPDWHTMFADYVAAVDWPEAGMWQPISEAFPDALILLSVRDPDAWWKSASSTIFKVMDDAYFGPAAQDNVWTQMMNRMMAAFTTDWRDPDAAKAAYLQHNQSVRDTAPPARLLEWSPGDGWEPICERLCLPVPDAPFPHTNTTAEFQAIFEGGDAR
jgi:hypothetical protein